MGHSLGAGFVLDVIPRVHFKKKEIISIEPDRSGRDFDFNHGSIRFNKEIKIEIELTEKVVQESESHCNLKFLN